MYGACMQSTGKRKNRGRHAALDQLDAAIVRLRRFWQRPGVKEFFREHLDPDHDAGVYRTLRAVEQASPRHACVGDVAEYLDVDQSTASRVIDGAVAAGYVERSVSDEDRRRSVLTLTDEGWAVLGQLRETRLALLGELTDGWAAADVDALATLLGRLDEAYLRLEQGPEQEEAGE